MAKRRANRAFGDMPGRKGKHACGVCGEVKQMSKAHVPPRCAGNELMVKRYRFVVNGHEANAGRGDLGGIHLYGLCDDCNSRAGRYDGAYGEFAARLRPHWVRSWKVEIPRVLSPPAVLLDPGAVARSILLAMCATGPLIHRMWPLLPMQLAEGGPVQLPTGIALYLALARGKTARVAGPISGFHVTGPHLRRGDDEAPRGINAVASVYFPPLAWELVHTEGTTLVDDGWADVSSWTEIRPGETRGLNTLVVGLPSVCHPWHHPTRSEGWAELLNSDLVRIVECDNVEGGPPDTAAPLTLNKRAHVSTKEFEELARRRGVSDTTL